MPLAQTATVAEEVPLTQAATAATQEPHPLHRCRCLRTRLLLLSFSKLDKQDASYEGLMISKCMHALGGELDEQDASCEGVTISIHACGQEEVAQNTGRTQNVCRCSGDHELAQVGKARDVGELVAHALLRVEDELYLRVE